MKTWGLLLSVVLVACLSSGKVPACEIAVPVSAGASAHAFGGKATILDRLRAYRRDTFVLQIDLAGDAATAPESRQLRTLGEARHRIPESVREQLAAPPVPRGTPLPEIAGDQSLAGPLFAAPLPIVNAIVKASAVTGADFEFLLKTAALESSFDPKDEAKTSTAVGLFQFITHTWLYMIREAGPELGLGDLASAIVVTAKGEFKVADAELEAAILRMRYDPELSAIMAGAFARRNAEFAARELGREADAGELYITHFLGADAGVELIRLAQKEPDALANKRFAGAARANRSIFYDGKRPRTFAEVHDRLLSKYRRIPIHADPEAVGSIN
jgi:hypothetical protein